MESIDNNQIMALLGSDLYHCWIELNHRIQRCYDTDRLWNKGYRDWVYEYKYRRGGKTLCTFYLKDKTIGCQIVFGLKEREKFELERADYSKEMQDIYDLSTTYHDGKWMLIPIENDTLFDDILKLLRIKKRPNVV